MPYNDGIWLNVGGQRFWTTWSTLRRPMCSRLARLRTSDHEYDPQANEFYFDRSGALFDHILDVHRTGTLHIPHQICIPKIVEEMKFWEVPVEHVAACCWHRIREYQCTIDRIHVLGKTLQQNKCKAQLPTTGGVPPDVLFASFNTEEDPKKTSVLNRIRNCVWLFLDEPYSSYPAMVRQQCIRTLRWRHNRCDSVSNHQPHHCLLNRLFRRRSKKTSKLRVTGLCAANSPGTGEFSAQMASNAENVSIWWRHHVCCWSELYSWEQNWILYIRSDLLLVLINNHLYFCVNVFFTYSQIAVN